MEHVSVPPRREVASVPSAGSLGEGIIGAGTIAVAIIALAGLFPFILLPIATIAIGAALLLQGGEISARIRELLEYNLGADRAAAGEMGTGISAEILGGLAGIALGILALAGTMPLTLVAVASLIFGVTLILGSGTLARIKGMILEYTETNEMARRIAREAVNASASVQLLIGLGAMTLGILALIGIRPLPLLLISMLVLGASDLLSGTALGSRLLNILER
jgi:hypothetical protein